MTPHQIHNVLRAYARRLRNTHALTGGTEAPRTPASLEDRRRLVSSKISMKMVEKIILARHKFHSQTFRSGAREPALTGNFTYRRITPAGEEIIAHMEMEDPGFLIRQMDAIVRDGEDDPSPSIGGPDLDPAPIKV